MEGSQVWVLLVVRSRFIQHIDNKFHYSFKTGVQGPPEARIAEKEAAL